MLSHAMNNSKFKLAVVELYSPYRHGFHKGINTCVYGHHIINYSVDNKEFYNELDDIENDLKYTNEMALEFLENVKYDTRRNVVNHPTIRNYEKIMKNPKQYELHIIEPIDVSTGDRDVDVYSAAIIKTHWLRIIQRRWRNIRKHRINNMKNIANIKHREINGNYPNNCNIKFTLGI
jgi:hypothetical protein